MISEEYEDLLTGPHVALLATVRADGAPQITPVWFLYVDGRVLVSTIKNRPKQRNVDSNPMVSLTVVDPNDPFRYIEVRGRVTVADDPTYDVRDRIVQKHGHADGSGFDAPGAVRVALTITPTRVVEH